MERLVGNYFPYGQERPSATTDGKEKFATYFRDSETGLDYADNRYHQVGMGRFMTPDPFDGSAKANDPGSWNRYAYSSGDPVNNSDPSGLDDSAYCGNLSAMQTNPVGAAMVCGAFGFSGGFGNIRDSLGAAASGGIACSNCGGAAQTFWDPSSPFYDGGDESGGPSLGGFFKSLGRFLLDRLAGGPTPPDLHPTDVEVTFQTDDGVTTIDYGWRPDPNAPVLKGEIPIGPGDIEAVEGIYEFVATSGRTYVGQSVNVARRIAEHVRSGKLIDKGTVLFKEVLGGRTAREIMEQQRIDELGGIRNLENQRNPIGPGRRNLMGGPQ